MALLDDWRAHKAQKETPECTGSKFEQFKQNNKIEGDLELLREIWDGSEKAPKGDEGIQADTEPKTSGWATAGHITLYIGKRLLIVAGAILFFLISLFADIARTNK